MGSLTFLERLMTWDTVAMETPASTATSLIVTLMLTPSKPFL
jgi:hypothetical protein